MTSLLIIAHADPSVAALYRPGLPPDWDVRAFVEPGAGLSSKYVALAHRVHDLEGLLKHLGLGPRSRWQRVVLASWSAGYGLTWPLMHEADACIGLDSGYTERDPDGTASDARLAPVVAYVKRARSGEVLFWYAHTEIRTEYASSADVAHELMRLGGEPSGLWRVDDWGGVAAKDHMDALRVHGPAYIAEALLRVSVLFPPDPCDVDSTRPTLPSSAPTLREVLVRMATAAVGTHEQGANAGAEVSAWLKAVGLPPGNPWCASFVSALGSEAAREAGERWPLAMTGRVASLIASCPGECWHDVSTGYVPEPGDLELYARDGQDPRHGGNGHVSVRVPGGLISGNDGDEVRFKRDPVWKIVGWISLG